MQRIMLPLALGLALAAGSACAPQRYSESRIVMNSPTQVIVYAPVPPDWDGVFSSAKATAALFDHRLADGALARLNRTGKGELPEPVFSTLKQALLLAQESGGAFDPTVLPLMELWDFEGQGRVPAAAEIESALQRTGWEKVRLAGNGPAVLESGARLDIGGIGEGVVVDAVAARLASLGFADYLVDAAGEIVIRGAKPGNAPWGVAVRAPRLSGMPRTAPDYSPERLGVLGIIDFPPGVRAAVSTSGDYQKFFVRDGKAYTHILDPRTGRPADGAVSVTVIAPTCAEADSLATAAFVLGFEKGYEFLEARSGAEGLIIREINGELEMKTTSGFPRLIPVDGGK